jgi:O-antigen/teichoic acid export membrane protein
MSVAPESSPTAVSAVPDPAPDASAASDLSDTTGPASVANQQGLVRNTFYLTAAQAVTIPLSVVTNALTGRYLGPAEFGYLYLATTLCSFGVLGMEWGVQGALPALVARDRSRAGTLLGTSMVWRAMSSLVVSAVLAVLCWVLGYQRGVVWAVALSFPLAILNSVAGGFKDAIRGFERTDIPAFAHVGQQLLGVAILVPVLVLGGDLRALLLSQIAVAGVTALYLRRSLKSVGIGALTFEKTSLKPLLALGTPFVFVSLAIALGPNINATFLGKLVPPEVIGWYSVSQRLIGLLIFPASALVSALYPTLCRLSSQDQSEFVRVSRSALYGVTLLAIPAAVGCGVFAEVGVAIFGTREFSGATEHLRVMSLFIFLVYFSMPLGTTILAANRQKIWTLVQCICLLVSLLGNPFLIPYFQKSWGNGAIGTCITLVLSELLVVACGVGLAPRGLFDRGFGKSLLLATLSGVAMVAVALLTKPISIFLAVPLSLLTYGVGVWFSGAVQPATIEMIKGILGRKLARFRK